MKNYTSIRYKSNELQKRLLALTDKINELSDEYEYVEDLFANSIRLDTARGHILE